MKVNESFEYQGKGQNFTRDNFATLAEMKAVKAKTFPDIFTATCSETGKFYIYNKDNEVDEVLGKWRELGGSSSGSLNPNPSPNTGASIKEECSVPFGYIIGFNSSENAETIYKKLELISTSYEGEQPAIELQGPNSYEFIDFRRDQGVYSTGYDNNGNEVDFGFTRYTLTFRLAGNTNEGDQCVISALYTDDGNQYRDLTFENIDWINVRVKDTNFGALPTYEVGKMNFDQDFLTTEVLVEEVIKHTDPIFLVKQFDPYESRTWVVTYSPYMNYRRPNTWTATYGNKLVVITKGYEGAYPLNFQEYTLGDAPTLFANNGPELPIYSFTQGSKTSEEMLDLIGNSYYASYTGDYGRGNEPFIPGQVESRADSATVYIENAPEFGTQKCKLFAVNTVGQVFEGFFVTTRTDPEFTDDGLVWREVENASGSETLTARDVENIVQENMPTAVVYSKQVYDSMSGEELYKFLKTIYENIYQKTNNFDNIIAESIANNTKLEITEFSCVSHDELISPMVMDRITEYTLLVKEGAETKRVAARGNLSREYTNTSVNSDSIKITAANPDFIETDTIDFSTWPEFTAPEATGTHLDGNGGLVIGDDSNVGVDPDDIEPDD